MHRLYDAAASPGLHLRSPGSLAIKLGRDHSVTVKSFPETFTFIYGTVHPLAESKVYLMLTQYNSSLLLSNEFSRIVALKF